jgi:5-methylcytosine-specific restriction endonuclease McrA
MPLVRCANCGERLERDIAVRRGVQSFCPEHPYKLVKNGPRSALKPTAMRRKRASGGPDQKLRQRVLSLDGNRCRFCGTKHNLHVHHVIYRSDKSNLPWQDEISNLLTLCQEHHDVVHSDKGLYLPLCLGVIWLRNVHGDKRITVPAFERRLNG